MTNIFYQTRVLSLVERKQTAQCIVQAAISSSVRSRSFSFVSSKSDSAVHPVSYQASGATGTANCSDRCKYTPDHQRRHTRLISVHTRHETRPAAWQTQAPRDRSTTGLNAVSRRWFASSCVHRQADDRSDDDQPRRVKGHLFYIPNPLKWLRSIWYKYRLQSQLDPGFSTDEFVVGSRQALAYLTQLISSEDYNAMADICGSEAVNVIRNTLSQWTTEQIASIVLEDDNILLALPYVEGLTPLADCHLLHIEVKFVAVKVHRDAPVIIDTILRFTRKYEKEAPSDWLITQLRHLKVKSALDASSD